MESAKLTMSLVYDKKRDVNIHIIVCSNNISQEIINQVKKCFKEDFESTGVVETYSEETMISLDITDQRKVDYLKFKILDKKLDAFGLPKICKN
jgi:hypothetical protein